MKRLLTFHYEGTKASGDRIGPAFYLEADYDPVALRIHADKAPDVVDAEFEILKDGVSVMNNRDSVQRDSYGRITSSTTSTTAVLTKGATSAEAADDFKDETWESGSWITCTLSKDGGGENFTLQCELEQASDEESEE